MPQIGKSFKEAYTDYKKTKSIQVATLNTVMGKECRQILGRLELTNDKAKDPAVVIEKLQSYFEPLRNIFMSASSCMQLNNNATKR